MIEPLEKRQLLAAVFFDQDSESIKIRGTQQADNISVIRRGERVLVQLNDRRRWFDLAPVKWVDIDGMAGDDYINAQHTPFSIHVYGGSGRDTIIGGWGDDHLNGADNADRLIGNAGDDDFRGGPGADRMIGGDGRDSFWGAGGIDFMSGGDGEDYFMADAGDDIVDGGGGADTAAHYQGRGEVRNVEGHTFYAAE